MSPITNIPVNLHCSRLSSSQPLSIEFFLKYIHIESIQVSLTEDHHALHYFIHAVIEGLEHCVLCTYSGPCDLRPRYLTILCILRPDISDITCIFSV